MSARGCEPDFYAAGIKVFSPKELFVTDGVEKVAIVRKVEVRGRPL
jgi:hypothetical protein